MIKRMKNPALLEAIQNGQLLLLSFVNPDAGFFTGNLMARNKFIYAQSVGTVIVRSEKKVEPGLVQMKTFEMDGALLSAGTSRSMMETKN